MIILVMKTMQYAGAHYFEYQTVTEVLYTRARTLYIFNISHYYYSKSYFVCSRIL